MASRTAYFGAGGMNPSLDPRRRSRTDFLGGGPATMNTTSSPSIPAPSTAPPAIGAPTGPVGNQYLSAADRVNQAAGRFQFTPDMNDPTLLAMKSRLSRGQQQRSLGRRDEYGRAGLLGTSQMIEGLGAQQDQFGTEQMELDQDIFGQRRGEELGLYRDDLGFRRNAELGRLGFLGQRELMELQRKFQEQDMIDQLLGGIGGVAGGLGYDYLSGLLRGGR